VDNGVLVMLDVITGRIIITEVYVTLKNQFKGINTITDLHAAGRNLAGV
jgi:hypothetical protein